MREDGSSGNALMPVHEKIKKKKAVQGDLLHTRRSIVGISWYNKKACQYYCAFTCFCKRSDL